MFAGADIICLLGWDELVLLWEGAASEKEEYWACLLEAEADRGGECCRV